MKIHQYIPTGNQMSVIAVRHRFDPWVGKIPWSRKWQPTPVFLPGKFYGQKTWWATVCGVTKSWTLLNMHVCITTMAVRQNNLSYPPRQGYYSSIFAWKIPWTEDLMGYSLWSHKELDMAEHACVHHNGRQNNLSYPPRQRY